MIAPALLGAILGLALGTVVIAADMARRLASLRRDLARSESSRASYVEAWLTALVRAQEAEEALFASRIHRTAAPSPPESP